MRVSSDLLKKIRMKKTLLVSSFMAAFFVGLAQPQFTNTHCFQVGDTSRLGFAVVSQNFDDFKPLTGPSYTWDFSTGQIPGPWTSWTAPTVEYKFQASSQSDHILFQNTQINEYALTAFARDVFYSYSSNNDTLYYEGLYASANYKAMPRYAYLTFPLNFNDSIGIWVQQFANPNQPTTATGSITRSWKYDGFGTILFPYGTASNVYRIKTYQIDSTYITNQSVVYEEFIWIRQSDGIPVLRFLKNGTSISAYYASADGSAPSNIQEILSSGNDFTMYPNPANDKLFLNNMENTHVSIINLNGEIVKNISIKDATFIIDVNELSNGFYFIKIEKEGVYKTSKIIINH